MTEYYSNKSDFSGQSTSVYSGTTGTGYYGATTNNSNPETKVTNMLDDISTVTTKVQNEGVSHLYRQTGDAALGTEKSSSTFTNAVDRSQTLLAAAKRIHREIMQTIDSKFVKGLDEAYTSLNDVNGSETTYQTTNMTHGVTKTYQMTNMTYGTAYGSQTATITVQEHYTLAEILGADSPILAAQDIYTQRLAAIKEMLKTGDNLTAKQIKKLKGKSDQELMETFYPTLQSDYEKIKGSSFQEDHKKELQCLEIGLTVVASLVAIVATAGTAIPAIAAAGTVANAYLFGSTAYSVATGETLITGTKLSTEERLWAAADLMATGLSAASTKLLGLAEASKLSTKAADVVEGSSSLLKVTKHADDVMDAINIGKDVVTGDVQSLVMDAGMAGLSMGVKAHNRGVETGSLTKLAETSEVASTVGKVDSEVTLSGSQWIVKKSYDSSYANRWLSEQGYTEPPYALNSSVSEITLVEPTKFVRVYDGENSNLYGGWVMKAEDIVGLSPTQIQEKIALPNLPKYVGEVNLPQGVTLRVGEVNPLFGKQGGGTQFDLMGQYVGDFKELGKLPLNGD